MLSKLIILICVAISEPSEEAVDSPVAMETEPSAPASQAGAAYSECGIFSQDIVILLV